MITRVHQTYMKSTHSWMKSRSRRLYHKSPKEAMTLGIKTWPWGMIVIWASEREHRMMTVIHSMGQSCTCSGKDSQRARKWSRERSKHQNSIKECLNWTLCTTKTTFNWTRCTANIQAWWAISPTINHSFPKAVVITLLFSRNQASRKTATSTFQKSWMETSNQDSSTVQQIILEVWNECILTIDLKTHKESFPIILWNTCNRKSTISCWTLIVRIGSTTSKITSPKINLTTCFRRWLTHPMT